MNILNNPYTPDRRTDADIIKEILLEKESTIAAIDKMYRVLEEASLADDISMDTDLINECVKTLNLLEGNEDHLSDEKIKAMKKNIEQNHREWLKSQCKKRTK